MRSGAPAGHSGYYHETALYGSDDEFVAVVGPFVRGGLDAGEPVVVACADRNAALLQEAVDCDGVRVLPGADMYTSPTAAIRTYQRMFDDLVGAGASQIRVVGDVPHPGVGADWHRWMRYEAVVNSAFGAYPVWGLCPYDTRTAPDHVLDDVRCTHPHLVTAGGGHDRNADYVDPAEFLDRTDSVPLPVAALGPPTLVLTDPDARTARRAVVAAAIGTLSDDEREDLAVVVSELVSNAHGHGRPPVTVSAWASAAGIRVSVADTGPGPVDPMVGLVPPPLGSLGGRGLWLAHQLCTDIRLHRADRYEVLVSVGQLPALDPAGPVSA